MICDKELLQGRLRICHRRICESWLTIGSVIVVADLEAEELTYINHAIASPNQLPNYYKYSFKAALTRQNGNVENTETADDPLSISVMVSLGLKNPQEVWSLVENSRIFLGALKFFFSEREQPINQQILTRFFEDLQQEFSCNINIKHRVEFDEEKEPDGMILSGWTQALTTENNKNSPAGNGTSTSSQALPVETVVDDEFEILPGGTETLPLGKKGKIADSSNASSISFEEVTKRKAEELEPDSHIVVLEDSMDKDDGKKKRLQ
ncbi:hypothetical protein POM88_035616 [Heracleum sosnowskyi]|uniref:Uncharacterized protein n=1 Tax=Heracleum sosnowskyi TaxID=360622 RepID=A0AAD8HNC8_9APIA|nr:hypothetical protein POM88_035616 [Heracleum sosnowskyi]